WKEIVQCRTKRLGQNCKPAEENINFGRKVGSGTRIFSPSDCGTLPQKRFDRSQTVCITTSTELDSQTVLCDPDQAMIWEHLNNCVVLFSCKDMLTIKG
ncbi:hypothetical protein TNCT_510271, partial [Trichonephila clavata]